MQFSVTKNGSSINSYVISCSTEKRICTGVGMLQLTVSNEYTGGFDPYDIIKISSGGLIGTYFVSQVDDQEAPGVITVYAQDASKKMVDYFIAEVYTIVEPEYNRTWIEFFLDLCGVTSIKWETDDIGTLISNNTTLGLSSVYDQVMYLCQIAGWYFHFDAENKIHIGKLQTDLSKPKANLNSRNIIEIHKISHDKMFRNRVVVWGRPSGYMTSGIGVEAKKITPWNYGPTDFRTIAIVNSNIPSSGIAQKIADEALDYFDEISIEKHITAIGAIGLDVGDACKVNNSKGVWTGKGLVTTFGIDMSKDGLKSNIILDEKCPRLFAYYDFGDYVYIGTVDSGVWRKHIKYGVSGWHNFNGGDLSGSGTGISDLFVRADLGTSVTFSGGAYYIYIDEGEPVQWHGVSLDSVRGEDEPSPPELLSDVKARACTIDRTTGDFRFLLDTWSGQNYKNYVDMFYHRFSSPFLFSGGLYSGTAPDGFFNISGYLLGSGLRSWIMSIPASGSVSLSGDYGVYPVMFSGIDSISGGYSVVGLDLENDGRFDYASVLVGKPPIFYINTVSGTQEYITGINAATRQVVTQIPTSGVVTNIASPQDIYCHNVGNMMASWRSAEANVVLLNNHFVNSTIPVTASGEYDFGVSNNGSLGGITTANPILYQSFTETDYVSLATVPSGTFMDGAVLTFGSEAQNNALIDKIGRHEIIRYNSTGNGSIETINYSFDNAGWNSLGTITTDMPTFGGLYPTIFGPMNGHIYTGNGYYEFLTYRRTGTLGGSPIYKWMWVYASEGISPAPYLDLTENDTTIVPTADFVENGIYYLTYGGGGVDPQGNDPGFDASYPRYLHIINGQIHEYEIQIAFAGMPADLIASKGTGLAWYRLRAFPYGNTFQIMGFAYVLRIAPSEPNSIFVYPIYGVGQTAEIGQLIYSSNNIAFLDTHSTGFVTFTRTHSAAYYQAYSTPDNFTVGAPINTVMNYGINGIFSTDPLVDGSGKYPWEATPGVKAVTPIASPLFDALGNVVDSTGLYITEPPFLARGVPIDLHGHSVASRPYTKPESNPITSFMVLRRDQSDFDIIAKGWLPYRLDMSHPSPLVTANLYRFSFETYYIPSSGTITQITQGHPLTPIFASGQILTSGVGFDIINDYRYATLETSSISGFGQQLLYTSSGGIWLTPVNSYETFNLYSGYVDAVASGVIIGSASMLETSNFAYPDQYLFLSTIAGPDNFRFYQKSPSGMFEDCSTYSGYPNSEITIIRLEDLV